MAVNKWQELEEIIHNRMTENNIPGAAIAVSHQREIIFQKGFGYGNIETKKPVTPRTIFGIASVTKSFTAMAIMKLEKEGKLSINDSVVKYIPEFNIQGVSAIEDIKIYHLLSHTTGLPPMRRREELCKLTDHLEYLANEEVELLGQPGEYFSYCNDSFLLLGIILERLTGQLYRRYITETILEPLKMYRSTFSLEEVSRYEDVSVPYIFNEKTESYELQDWPKLGNYEVGGGIRSNVLDLLKYGEQYLDSHSNFTKMWKPIYEITKNAYYGTALQISHNYSGVTLVEHGGGQPGVSSHFGFVPEKDLVVVVLTNVSGAPSSEIWLNTVNAVLDLPLEQKRKIHPIYEASIDELLKFEGTYQSAEGGLVTIILQDGHPKAEIEGELFELCASDKETLLVKQLELPLRFYCRDGAKAWAVLYGSRMLQRKHI